MPPRRPALDVISHSPDQTRRLGFHLGRFAKPGDVVLLSGDIGTGKTTFVQGFAKGLNIDDYIQSPTFALAAEHAGLADNGAPVMLYHLDLYRLERPADVATFGYDDYFDDPQGIVVVEWPDRIPSGIPDEYLLVDFEYLADAKRRLHFRPNGARYDRLIDTLRTEVFGAQRRPAGAGD